MNDRKVRRILHRPKLHSVVFSALVISALVLLGVTVAHAGTLLSVKGYLDYSYGTNEAVREPTDGRSENKLWWNDGIWWGSLFNPEQEEYHIYRLDWSTQTWQDTGVKLDDRLDSRADTLWDEASQKLYVASHVKLENPSNVNDPINAGRLYRFSYNGTTDTYILDSGYPVFVNRAKTRTLSLDKDAAGRLWVAYVSRPGGTTDYQVYVNYSAIGDDTAWNATPFSLRTFFSNEALVSTGDIAAVVAFEDDQDGPMIGVMWSNERAGVNRFYFASHSATSDPTSGWQLETLPALPANDHINLKTTSSGQVIGIVKTSATEAGHPLNALLLRDTDGTWSSVNVNPVGSNDTKPIAVVYEPTSGPDKIYMFMTNNVPGGLICSMAANITSPLSNISFTPRNCTAGPDVVLGDASFTRINNATSTRQILNEDSDIVVLAGDEVNGKVYVHAVVLNPPPAVISRLPAHGGTAATNTVIRAGFNKSMNASTINTGSFTVTSTGGPVSGTVAYNATTRTATFTPTNPLEEGTFYTVTLSGSIQDTSGEFLMDAPVTWSFWTEGGDPPPHVVDRSPMPGQVLIPETVVISATFSKDMNPATFSTSSFKVDSTNGPVVGTVAYNAASRTATFTPAAPLPVDLVYTVTLTDDIQDTVGVMLFDAPVTWTFTVVADLPPTVLSHFPEAGAVLRPEQVGSIWVTFDDVMDDMTINEDSFMLLAGDEPVEGTVTYDPDSKTATFTPTNPLLDGSEYTVVLTGEIQDSSGKPLMDAPYSWTFTISEEAQAGTTVFLPLVLQGYSTE